MKTITRTAFALLTVAASSTAFAAQELNIEVDSTDVATVSSNMIATKIYKKGDGTVVLSGDNAAGSSQLEINNGLVQVSAQNNMPSTGMIFNAETGKTASLEVTAGTDVLIPTISMNTVGTVTIDSGANANVNSIGGTNILTLAGAGTLDVTGDMSASSTPFTVDAGAHMTVGGLAAYKATKGNHAIHGILELLANTDKGAVPGTTEIFSGAEVRVAAGLTVPAAGNPSGIPADANDIFGTATLQTLVFDSGSKLVLGDGAVWARDITVGTPL